MYFKERNPKKSGRRAAEPAEPAKVAEKIMKESLWSVQCLVQSTSMVQMRKRSTSSTNSTASPGFCYK
jgi:hypothetical protein